jgi:hypothetical protein
MSDQPRIVSQLMSLCTCELSGGRRIEVQCDFDTHTFERLMSVLERM